MKKGREKSTDMLTKSAIPNMQCQLNKIDQWTWTNTILKDMKGKQCLPLYPTKCCEHIFVCSSLLKCNVLNNFSR